MSDSSKWEITKSQQSRFIAALTSELAPLRAKVGISQGELASLIGISRQTYSAIESDKRMSDYVNGSTSSPPKLSLTGSTDASATESNVKKSMNW